MAGEVIGMNTAIYTQSTGSQGVGFAMPANIIVSVYNMLISPDHKVTRGSIGISFQSTPSPLRSAASTASPTGESWSACNPPKGCSQGRNSSPTM